VFKDFPKEFYKVYKRLNDKQSYFTEWSVYSLNGVSILSKDCKNIRFMVIVYIQHSVFSVGNIPLYFPHRTKGQISNSRIFRWALNVTKWPYTNISIIHITLHSRLRVLYQRPSIWDFHLWSNCFTFREVRYFTYFRITYLLVK